MEDSQACATHRERDQALISEAKASENRQLGQIQAVSRHCDRLAFRV
jgi:hypothetical protein